MEEYDEKGTAFLDHGQQKTMQEELKAIEGVIK